MDHSRMRQILCMMIFPPDLDGHGGSQRAWHLVKALRPYGSIHFVLVFSDGDRLCTDASLSSLEPLVASITRVNIKEWRGRKGKVLRFLHPKALDTVRFGSAAAPRFSRNVLRAIARRLPAHDFDLIFAGRVTCAAIVQALIDHELLSARRKVVDFDDIISEFRSRQVRQMGASLGLQGRLLGRLEVHLIGHAERRIARDWHGVSVCSDEDATSLGRKIGGAKVVKVPNVVCHDAIPASVSGGRFRCLFVGNLGFTPNVEGLGMFMRVAWPAAREAIPGLTLTIVGFNPTAEVLAFGAREGVTVHANAPSLLPFYEDCDVVIAPILFGSGTRVKILEAMAYGRAVVSTEVGAEGLELEDHRHAMLVRTMTGFAAALEELARNPALRQSIVDEARAFQEEHFGPSALTAAMPGLVGVV